MMEKRIRFARNRLYNCVCESLMNGNRLYKKIDKIIIFKFNIKMINLPIYSDFIFNFKGWIAIRSQISITIPLFLKYTEWIFFHILVNIWSNGIQKYFFISILFIRMSLFIYFINVSTIFY